MMHLIRLLLSWSVRRIVMFVMIVAAMIVFVKALDAWNRLPALGQEIEALEGQQRLLTEELARQREEARTAIREMERLEQPALRRRLDSVRGQIAELENGRASGVGLALQMARGEGGALAARRHRLRLQLLRQEQSMIVARLQALERAAASRPRGRIAR